MFGNLVSPNGGEERDSRGLTIWISFDENGEREVVWWEFGEEVCFCMPSYAGCRSKPVSSCPSSWWLPLCNYLKMERYIAGYFFQYPPNIPLFRDNQVLIVAPCLQAKQMRKGRQRFCTMLEVKEEKVRTLEEKNFPVYAGAN